MSRKISLIIGAGCTVSDVSTRPKIWRPPLDKGFFSIANTTNPTEAKIIVSYITENYGLDILQPENDSLEQVMAMIYTDVFDPNLEHNSSRVFRELITLFNQRLADTTNNLRATQQRYLYRIVSYYLKNGVKPKDITIVTFNQDIQIEKVLYKLAQTERYKKIGTIFNFPYCYSIPISSATVTGPTGTKSKEGLFKLANDSNLKGIRILKLHGSLNWHSTHRSRKPSPRAMFRPNRVIRITQRQIIATQMTFTGTHHAQHTLPVIVPPVTHKSAILHNYIKPLWRMAEQELRAANEVVIFGYSCPVMDFESSNLIQRSLKEAAKYKDLSIIDPDSSVLTRYINLIKPPQITCYPSATDFLQRK